MQLSFPFLCIFHFLPFTRPSQHALLPPFCLLSTVDESFASLGIFRYFLDTYVVGGHLHVIALLYLSSSKHLCHSVLCFLPRVLCFFIASSMATQTFWQYPTLLHVALLPGGSVLLRSASVAVVATWRLDTFSATALHSVIISFHRSIGYSYWVRVGLSSS